MLGPALLALVSKSQPFDFMCVQVPENIHTHPGNSEGVGGTKESMKLSHSFQRGGGFKVKKTIRGGGMDIFWNHTMNLGNSLFIKTDALFWSQRSL